uniref:Protein kinase domain-containing protein n=4 Tax=Rhodosorus marinus TaxID=101924 RepID=A0A7S3EJ14_9RHOD|mmetsp:Transcript_39764/g.158198  ORF Transcript_39764/g.158198 Transcript_39764/m.158198 type:complete len:789 (+) Transcript_39764:97-2463(+)|eukprot:CAMPEP_0113970734 /NCGR_PEP_ID=MMETSP0011_2-20120614/11498_1 /TAXON_ID=101924 /ORGANISM="Rhodosorus marinus" /LENGTH=788 /DNA_ID=CAMNT_0000985457 /DNA_START=145 /DNA_END=2511 /DNA_ORIENTATION=- /assembly_acc=CAM_ASM_000156
MEETSRQGVAPERWREKGSMNRMDACLFVPSHGGCRSNGRKPKRRRRVFMVQTSKRTSLPVKLAGPKKVEMTKLPTRQQERDRFERLGKRVSRDGLYVEQAYDFDSKFGMEWFHEVIRKYLNDTFRGGLREFLVYEPEMMEKYYDRNPLIVLQRISQIVLPFSIWAVEFLLAKRFNAQADGQIEAEKAEVLAGHLRKTLITMGPTFVKIGQGLSQRPDLIGPIFADQLKKLQDSVATFPSDVAFDIMLAEFDRPLDEIFDFITKEPIASASLGQVYKAHLVGAPENEFVAVKVQRPKIGAEASVDLYLTRRLAPVVKKVFKLRTNLVGVNDEFGVRLFEETNYVQEARNCDRFRSLYSDIDGIFIPKTCPEWTTRYVLCMEWVEGTKAPWGEDALRIIDVGIQCTLRQLLDGGYFHADPHPGNLIRTVDGRLAYIDFGMMSEVQPQKRYDLISSIMHLINQDYNGLAVDLVNLEFLPVDADVEAIAPLLKDAFTKANEGNPDGESMSSLSFNELARQMAGVAYKSPIRLPPYYSLVIRSLTILEGIALTVNKDFKIVDESFPYVSKRILMDADPEMRKRLREALVDPTTQRIRWHRLRRIVQEGQSRNDSVSSLAKGGNRRILDESSLVEKVAQYVLSEDGEFLRDALVEDLVDAVDSAQLALQDSASNFSRGLIPKPIDEPDRQLLAQLQKLLTMLARETRVNGRHGAIRRLQTALTSGSLDGQAKATNSAQVRLSAEAQRILTLVVGRLLERNSTRAMKSFLVTVEGIIDLQVARAKDRNSPQNKS